MPGAARLLAHLRAHGVPTSVATSTSRATFDLKMKVTMTSAATLSSYIFWNMGICRIHGIVCKEQSYGLVQNKFPSAIGSGV